MEDKELRNLSVLLSIFGIVLLYFVANNLEPEVVQISDIEYKDVGKTVKITGEITSRQDSKGHIFLKVSDGTSEMFVPLFENLVKKLSVEEKEGLVKDREIEVVGEVQEYNGKLEIIPRRAEDITQ